MEGGTVDPLLLTGIIRRIVTCAHPEKNYPFRIRSTGETGADSASDLLMIKKENSIAGNGPMRSL